MLLWCACGIAAAGDGTAAAPAGARAVDTLRLADGGTLVLGTAVGAQGAHAALWRLRRDGTIDTTFAGTGMLVATGVPDSRGVSIERSADGVLQVAVQSGRAGAARLEVHRWPAGMEAPPRVTHQPVPAHRVGPAMLLPPGAGWAGAGPARPLGPPLPPPPPPPPLPLPLPLPPVPLPPVPVPVTRGSPWTAAALAAPAPVPEVPAAVATTDNGHAIFEPFAGASPARPSAPAMAPEASGWPTALALTLIAAVAGAVWWRRRA